MESAAIGLLAGRFAAAERLSASRSTPPPPTTAHGALLGHITGGHVETIDAGAALLPADERQFRAVSAARACRPKGENGQRLRGTEKTLAKKRALARRALADLERWIAGDARVAAAAVT